MKLKDFTPYDEISFDADIARDLGILASMLINLIFGGLRIAPREDFWPDQGPWMVLTAQQVTDAIHNTWSLRSVKKTMKKLEAMGILRAHQHGKATAYHIDVAAIDRYVTHREPSNPE